MQRMFNIDKWAHLTQGTRMELPSVKARKVRLEVNTPAETQLYLVPHGEDGEPDGELVFLALVRGRDTIEFHTTGKVSVLSDGADCFVYTADGDDISSTIEAPVIFTKIMERRPRNLELERIAHEMQANMLRNQAAQAAELEALYERRFQAREAQLAADAAARSAALEPAPNGDGEPSDPPAA